MSGFRDIEESVLGLTNLIIGRSATYTPTVGTASAISGVFDNAFVDINGTTLLRPVFRIRLSDLAAKPKKSDQVLIDAVAYIVIDSQEDGYGGSSLVLQKV
jgi:hypothetical protein